MGKPKHWKKLKETNIADCRVFNVDKAEFAHPDGRHGNFFMIKSSDWVQAIPLFDSPEKNGEPSVLIVNQFRFAKEELSWEFPGGVMEKDEKPIFSAKREMLEETGFGGGRAKLLAKIYPNPAIQTNSAFIVLIENPKKISEVNWDANEEIDFKIVPVSKLFDAARKGKIKHSIALNAIYFLQEYLNTRNVLNSTNKIVKKSVIK